MRTILFAAALTLAPLSGLAESHGAPYDADTVLATVNGSDITLGHLIALQERLPEQYRTMDDVTLYNGMLEQLIDQMLIAQSLSATADTDTKRISLMLENERAALLANLVVGEIAASEVTDAELQAAYDAKHGNVEPAEEINASHILVETEDEAKAVIAELDGGADFAELAKEKSTGPSGPRGGELGWFGKGQMVAPFEAAALALESGGVSEPVQTQFGWHVIKLNDRRDVPPPEMEAVEAELIQEIRSERITAKLDEIRAAGTITRTEALVPPTAMRESDLLDAE